MDLVARKKQIEAQIADCDASLNKLNDGINRTVANRNALGGQLALVDELLKEPPPVADPPPTTTAGA